MASLSAGACGQTLRPPRCRSCCSPAPRPRPTPRGRAAGANAFVRKPFSPLELLETIEQLAGGLPQGPFRLMTDERPEEQLLLYAQDLRRLLELERSQRLLIHSAYEETVMGARATHSKPRTSARARIHGA